MLLSSPQVSRSYLRPELGKLKLAIRVATGFLITIAAALLLIRAGAWLGALPEQTDLLALLFN